MRRGIMVRLRLLALLVAGLGVAWLVYREWGLGGLSALAFAWAAGIVVFLVLLLSGRVRSRASLRTFVPVLVLSAVGSVLIGVGALPFVSRPVAQDIGALAALSILASVVVSALARRRGRRG